MPVWRLQVSFGADSAFPRDRIVITPHFNDRGIGTDPGGLCQDLATALKAWSLVTREINVRAYDAQGAVPVFPQGDRTTDVGITPASSGPRELSLCLSFYAGQNRPKYRGRLYLPNFMLNAAGTPGVRPSATSQSKLEALVPIFAGLGGADVDWCVYSRVDNVARKVSNYWIDDEWDVMRSRGLRPATRLQGTTGG